MDLKELAYVWFNGDKNDIEFVNTAYHILLSRNVLTDEDEKRYDVLYRDMVETMEEYAREQVL